MNFLLYTKYAYVMLFLIFIYLVDFFFIRQTSSLFVRLLLYSSDFFFIRQTSSLQCVSFLEHLQHLLA